MFIDVFFLCHLFNFFGDHRALLRNRTLQIEMVYFHFYRLLAKQQIFEKLCLLDQVVGVDAFFEEIRLFEVVFDPPHVVVFAVRFDVEVNS